MKIDDVKVLNLWQENAELRKTLQLCREERDALSAQCKDLLGDVVKPAEAEIKEETEVSRLRTALELLERK